MPEAIPIKDHEKESRLVNKRLLACAVLVVAITCALVARMYFLQVVEFDYHSTVSENNRVHVLPITPTRGLIYDRNGVVLADNRPSFNLTITRERTTDLKGELDTVVDLLHLPPEDRTLFDKEMKQARHPFVPVTLFYELTEEQIAVLAVNEYRLPGLDVEAQFVRHYPLGAHFAHSIGYVGRINEKEAKTLDSVEYRGTQSIGKTGIEKFYEAELHGHVGYEEVETNAQGRVMRVLKHTDPIPGKSIVLSLDIKLQEAAEEALGDRRGSVVALDPATGEVLAMVSKPSFDPNLFVTGISFKEYAALHDSIDRPCSTECCGASTRRAPPSSRKWRLPASIAAWLPLRPESSIRAITNCRTSTTSTATGTTAAMAGWTWTQRSCVPTTPTSMTWRTSSASTACTTTWRCSVWARRSLWTCSKSLPA
ncbi:hypothetical protein PBOI14_54080 [Pseudomonas sp. Boi14]|nr:hypothetical protein PBOI14_54080 [Pseudomonas sp. Boi14]